MKLSKQKQSMNPKIFKETFKVGDFVSGWATGLTLQITAIGETRILGWVFHRGFKKEMVATMHLPWRKVND